MIRHITKSVLLLGFTLGICCVAYPLVVWVIAQAMFPDQANGSLVRGEDGAVIGSRLIAQPFTKDEYLWPRPSAASYDASASASFNLLTNASATPLSKMGCKAPAVVGKSADWV